ncbi:MAG: hypothetical protein KJ063_11260, partial [Anaerolineae bacterium]|nr:hypothetical protein [Anaerolineae bacterium]
PFVLDGYPFALGGCPFVLSGCPFVLDGYPFALGGCPFVLGGCKKSPNLKNQISKSLAVDTHIGLIHRFNFCFLVLLVHVYLLNNMQRR